MGASWAGGESVEDRILSLLNSLPEPQYHGEARGGGGDNGETDVFSCRMGWVACDGVEVAWLVCQDDETLPECFIPERHCANLAARSFTAMAVVNRGWRRYSRWYRSADGWADINGDKMFKRFNFESIKETVQKSQAEGALTPEAA